MATRKTRERRAWGSVLKKDGRYYVRFVKADGKRTTRLAGTTRKSAEDLLKSVRAEVETAPVAEPLRLEDWLHDEYLRVLNSRLKESSLMSAAAHFTRLCDFLRDEAGDPTMDAVTRAHAEEFAAWMTEQDYKPSYIRRLVTTLRRAWNDALARNLVAENPWEGMRLAKAEPREVPWVTPTQLHALYGLVTSGQRALIVLLGETGLRLGEALALRWSDLDLAKRQPTLHVRKGKTQAARRTVPLSARALAAVATVDQGSADDPVFTPRSEQGVLRAMKVACEKAELPQSRVHELRHWYASHLVQAGVPPSTVAALLGHADGGALVCRLYGRWMPNDAEQRAMAQLAAFRATPGTDAS